MAIREILRSYRKLTPYELIKLILTAFAALLSSIAVVLILNLGSTVNNQAETINRRSPMMSYLSCFDGRLTGWLKAVSDESDYARAHRDDPTPDLMELAELSGDRADALALMIASTDLDHPDRCSALDILVEEKKKEGN